MSRSMVADLATPPPRGRVVAVAMRATLTVVVLVTLHHVLPLGVAVP
ncbi:hypothetical protein [Actinomycetospora chibensis]|uniref:Uncharacterized protein n=1 Tax=Actinomycetospora chibensis TaxID=663606 RepID=A0ABV9REM4_9PSEU|nr:hypothetical protein [Actinomycetospora chibensis]MDD7927176.1 hypothetical protein [Actinomycetospora chibensis]